MFDRAAECMPRNELKALQLSRLKSTLERAYNKVPHYKKKFDAAGVKPGDLKSLADLARFPFTVKTDLRDNYPFGLFAVPREQVLRLHASSGTTGKPTVVGYTKADLNVWADLMARCFAAMGARPGDIIQNAYGYGLFTGGLGAHYGAERLGCTVVPISGGSTERQIMLLQDFGATILCATPCYALNIAEVAESWASISASCRCAPGFSAPSPGPTPCAATSRRGSASRRSTSTACRRSSARASPANAARRTACTSSRIISFRDRRSRDHAAEPMGEAGELVMTTLTKEAMPMIRYRTRDITRLSRRALRLRAHAMRASCASPAATTTCSSSAASTSFPRRWRRCWSVPGTAPHYQIVLTREGALDAMTVEVEQAPGFRAATAQRKAAEVAHHIKSLIGVTCKVV